MPLLVCLRVGAVEHLDVFEHVLSCSVACEVGSSLDPLAFQQVEEAFGGSVVMAITATAHTGIQIVFAEKRLPILSGEL